MQKTTLNTIEPYANSILVVDDTPANLRLLSDLLAEQGYKVRSAISGEIALRAALAAPPDLIMLDINMPEMSGYEVCEHLKNDAQTCDIPIIFISALGEIHDKVAAFTAGGVDYITKPFQFEEVLARVETHIALMTLQRRLQQEITQRDTVIEELDVYIHALTHELKSPLSGVITYSEMLGSKLAENAADQEKSTAQQISKAGHTMNAIIDKLTLLTNVRKTVKIDSTPLDMQPIIAYAQARISPTIDETHAQITLPDQWPVASGDALWVEEVWVQYLDNALTYGGQPPCITLGAIQSPHHVKFWIEDNGPGIVPEHKDCLFKPCKSSDQAAAYSNGLGLTVVRTIVEKLGGSVGVESMLGQGSTFWFTLPTPQR